MAKVFGVHTVELLPGVKEEDFEKFMIEEGCPVWSEGVELYLLKGDKGERVGKYVILFVIDSVEVRNRVFGPPGGPSPGLPEAVKAAVAKYRTFATSSGWADYVVVGE
jgi:hypothetical protein